MKLSSWLYLTFRYERSHTYRYITDERKKQVSVSLIDSLSIRSGK